MMANRPALIPQSDATRLMKAARAAGYTKVSLRIFGASVEVIGEIAKEEDHQNSNSWDEVLHK